MKKMLSFAIALFFGLSVFAQDAVHYPLDQLPGDWQMSQCWADQGYDDWDFSNGFALSDAEANSYAGGKEGAATYLMTPQYALSSANATGTIEWTAMVISYDDNSASAAYVYASAVDITAQVVYTTEVEELSSEDGIVTFIYAWDEFKDDNGNPLSMSATEHNFVFTINHLAQLDANGGYAVSDFILRKRSDVYLQFFYDQNGQETAGYIVTDAGGSFVAPNNPFTAPVGQSFAYWATYDENDNVAGTLTEGQSATVDMDNYWFAVFERNNGGNGGGNGGSGNGGNEGGNGGNEGGNGGNEGGNGGGNGGNEGGNGGGTNGIESADLSNVSIFPNPAQNMVRVNGVTVSRLDLMDLTGRTVRSVEGGNTVDLSGLNNGVYMLRVSASEGTTVRKIVKK